MPDLRTVEFEVSLRDGTTRRITVRAVVDEAEALAYLFDWYPDELIMTERLMVTPVGLDPRLFTSASLTEAAEQIERLNGAWVRETYGAAIARASGATPAAESVPPPLVPAIRVDMPNPIGSGTPETRPATAKPAPVTQTTAAQEVLRRESTRTLLATSMGTAEIEERIPAAIRARTRFSATTTYVSHLATIDAEIQALISGQTDPASSALKLKESLRQLGYQPDPKKAGTLRDLSSFTRRMLILDTGIAQAGGYGQFVQSQSDESRTLYPAWEMYRAIWPQGAKRLWVRKWAAARRILGESSTALPAQDFNGDGGFFALKDDPIWTLPLASGGFNRFGTPYPPFDFYSGMRLRPVARNRALELKLVKDDTVPARDPHGFLDDLAGQLGLTGSLPTVALNYLRENGLDAHLRDGALHVNPLN